MKNSFVLVLRNHHYILSAKRSTNPWSTYSFLVTYLVNFGKKILPWLQDNNINFGELKEADLIFDKFDIQDDSTFINHIPSWGKYYIYCRKCQYAKPSVEGFIAKTCLLYTSDAADE